MKIDYRKRNQSRKTIKATFDLLPSGKLLLNGNETMVLRRINQYKERWERTNTREFAKALRDVEVMSL